MIKFLLNEECQTVLPDHLGRPLVDFIRAERHLHGTKIGCREGDCGACTVLLGEIRDGELVYIPATSCITPVGNVHGKHVVTIEGLNLSSGLNRVQKAFLDENATQCGFCTPGFIVSLICFALSDSEMNYTNAISAIDGNICRCTGYKSIERAIAVIVKELGNRNKNEIVDWLISHEFLPPYFQTIKAELEKIMPVSPQKNGRIVGGGTDLLVQELEEFEESEQVSLIAHRKDLKYIKKESGFLVIGAATTTEMIRHSDLVKELLPDVERYMKLISSTQIRSIATIAGNMINGSPIGDLSILFLALDAIVKTATREIPLKDFFKGYKKVDLAENELVTAILVPWPKGHYHFNFEKISKREYLDIATVNSALKFEFDDQGIITKASYSAGGVGQSPLFLHKSAGAAIGKKVGMELFFLMNKEAQAEISPRSRADYKRSLVRNELFAHLLAYDPTVMSIEELTRGVV